MSDRLVKFMFHGAPVRGQAVRLGGAWRDMIEHHDYPAPVMRLLGEMVAAAALLASNIKFNGALVMQVHGDGPVKLLVVETQPDLAIRATAKLREGAQVPDNATMRSLINAGGRGRFALTLDPKDRLPGQQPYQGVVPLEGDTVADVLQLYMRQSEQLETRLWLAADTRAAAGVLLQRIPGEGGSAQPVDEDDDTWERSTALAQTLTPGELLTLREDEIVRRLFWQEKLDHYEPLRPHFRCSCSRERIGRMLLSLGREEVDSIITELGAVTVTCDFCNRTYTFDPVDVVRLFTSGETDLPQGAKH